MRSTWIVFGCVFLVAGCARHTAVLNAAAVSGESTLSKLRAKADPEVLADIKSREAASLKAASVQQAPLGAGMAGLPIVSQALFAPPAERIASGEAVAVRPEQASSANDEDARKTRGFSDHQDYGRVQAASYGSYGGYGGGSLIPPPPAVSLSTQAQPLAYGTAPELQAQYDRTQPAETPRARNPGSLFDTGAKIASDAGVPISPGKSASFTAITPLGMDARSPYKQRDDLKLLWKGAISTSCLQNIAQRDEKIARALNRIEPGLPGQASKGAFNVTQRQADAVFKNTGLDRKVDSAVRQSQLELVQAYYRYLYAYNKYALAQQTVAARKQEISYADSAAEEQRARVDLSSAQSDAGSARDDLKAAQYELASAGGAQSARLIIGRVSGVAPSADSLTLAAGGDTGAAAGTRKASGKVGSIFHLRKAAPEKITEAPGSGSEAKGKKKARLAARVVEDPDDLQPAPDPAADNTASPEPVTGGGAIAFKLNNVDITPRKSVLKVTIKNNGKDNFSFDPEVFSVSEGNKKLSEAVIRADFDTTLVPPDQEVSGTITIFGRPWSDSLAVSLADSGKTIPLSR